jgi:hypothetical protein
LARFIYENRDMLFSRCVRILLSLIALAVTVAPATARAQSPTPTPGAIAYAQKVQNTSPGTLIGFWKLNETSGSLAYDSSGLNLTATISGSMALAQTPGPATEFGSAPLFDGSNDSVNLPSTFVSLFQPASGTVCAWLKGAAANNWGDSYAHIFSLGSSVSANKFAFQNDAPGNQLIGTYGGASFTYVASAYATPTTNWAHYCVIWSHPGQMVIYRNGTQISSSGALGSTFATGTALGYLGRSNTSNYFRGYMSHVAVWNVVLSSAQIAPLADPNPTPFTPTPTLPPSGGSGGIDPRFYQLATLESGQYVALEYIFSGGEVLISTLLIVIVVILAFGLFVFLARGNR